MARILIGKEHDAKLAYNRVEAGIRERQCGGIGRLKLDRLVGAKFLTGDFQHRRIEIGGDQMRLLWQQIAQAAGHDPGARGNFQNAPWSRRRGSPSDVVGKIGKEYGSKPVIVKLRNTAGEVGGSVAHDAPFCRGLNRTRLLDSEIRLVPPTRLCVSSRGLR